MAKWRWSGGLVRCELMAMMSSSRRAVRVAIFVV